jgi:hypothetical protein
MMKMILLLLIMMMMIIMMMSDDVDVVEYDHDYIIFQRIHVVCENAAPASYAITATKGCQMTRQAVVGDVDVDHWSCCCW